jgi:uncharacterized phage infection (PIP) family protein YhgE
MDEILEPLGQAPPITQICGNLALAIGVAGFVLMLVLGLWYLLDAVQIPAQPSPRGARPFRWGPLHHALKGIVQPGGEIRTALSADAVGELLFSRLQSSMEARQALGRFLAYAPLLVGLAGTMLGLSGLLHLLETSGSASGLGRVQLGGEGVKNLQGVFYGTLGGIVGSLLASTGSLTYGFFADHWTRRAEAYLNDAVLPRIPEQRVSLKLEDAVLALIETRIQAITRELSRSLEPLASGLAATAIEAAEAAKTSGAAFATAARAVSGAGDLEAAAKALSRGIKDNKATADDLGDAAIALREVARAQAGMEEALAHAAGRLETSSSQLEAQVGRVNEGVTGHVEHVERSIQAFAMPLDALGGEIKAVGESFSGLASSVSERNRIEDDVIASTLRSAQALDESLATVRTKVGEFSQEVVALRQQLEKFSERVTAALGAEFGAKVDALSRRLEDALREVASPLAHGAARMQQAGSDIEETVAKTKSSLPGLESSLDRLAELLQELTQGTVTIGGRVIELNSTLQGMDNRTVPPAGETEMTAVLKDMVHQLDALRRELARPKSTQTPSLPPRRGPLRWLLGK